jgi:hypothetical protein
MPQDKLGKRLRMIAYPISRHLELDLKPFLSESMVQYLDAEFDWVPEIPTLIWGIELEERYPHSADF